MVDQKGNIIHNKIYKRGNNKVGRMRMKKAIVWMLLMLLLTGCAGNVKSGVNLLKEKK